MQRNRFQQITSRYRGLTITLAGDFCLDRYLEIDPGIEETSIETSLPVHNVTRVRSQPGGAGTILNNLQALGIGRVLPVGFAGFDGEGYELMESLRRVPCLDLSADSFIQTPLRRTFTYCKPLICEKGKAPRELNRLDFKNFEPTPETVTDELVAALEKCLDQSGAIILLDQVDIPDTGVLTAKLISTAADRISGSSSGPLRFSLADSRQRPHAFSGLGIKVNREEFTEWHHISESHHLSLSEWTSLIDEFGRDSTQPLFVSLSEKGIAGRAGTEKSAGVKAWPTHGEIDIVGAGDCTTANLISALAAGATASEAMEIAMAAASVVIHKLGTTGTASLEEIEQRLFE